MSSDAITSRVASATRLVNVTPHSIVIRPPEGDEVTLLPSGVIARCSTSTEPVGSACGVLVVKATMGALQDLPAEEAGVLYVGSLVVALAAKAAGRSDVVSPLTDATAIRKDGQVVAVRGLQYP